MESIQLDLFSNFLNEEDFTLKEATHLIKDKMKKTVNNESIRARIYEGIDKGIFKRLGRGIYKVISQVNSDVQCLLINGNGRDLSFLEPESVDGIVTDHPYDLEKALKGGNRKFATYELFKYCQNDFDEKYRVLKEGSFCVEFLPEESESNFEYLYELKKMAIKSGFKYYAKTSWKKGNFVSNTGRKAKNKEDILILTKGTPRSLKLDAKKNIATAKENGIDVKNMASNEVKKLLVENNLPVSYMKGTNGMLPTDFDFQPKGSKEKIMEAEKPIDLLKSIIDFISKPKETLLDQFAGSGNFGIACLEMERNCILIEKSIEIYEKLKNNITKYLGSELSC